MALNYKNILITSGAGCAGSNIVKRRGSELNIFRLSKAGAAFRYVDIRHKEDMILKEGLNLIVDKAFDWYPVKNAEETFYDIHKWVADNKNSLRGLFV